MALSQPKIGNSFIRYINAPDFIHFRYVNIPLLEIYVF